MKRVLTSLALVPLVLYVVLLGPYWLLLAVVALVAVICYREYASIVSAYHNFKLGPVGYAAGLCVLLAGQENFELLVVVTILALMLSMRMEDLSLALPRSASLLFGVIYVFGCWKFAILLHNENPYWLLYVLVLTWVGDIAAYCVGKPLGRHRLAPRISPGKSWEGAVGSVVGSVAVGFFLLRELIPSVHPWAAVGLSALVNVAGQFGDLAESTMKRGAHMKDSGSILPGHGGLLDRVDSTLFALPVLYLYLRIR